MSDTNEGIVTNKMFETESTDNGLQDEVNAFIAGFEDSEAEALVKATPAAEAVESESEEPEESAPEVKPAGSSGGSSVTPEADQGMARLLARETEVRAKEANFEKLVNEAVAKRTPQLKGKSHEDVLKMAGLDPELVLKQMMYDRASDTNPVKAKLKEELRDLHHKKEIDSVRSELERRDMEKAQRDYFQSIDNGAREYVTKADEKVTPRLAKVAKTKPERAHARIMQEIRRDAADRLAKGEDGEPLAYAEAAKLVEAEWAELAELFAVNDTGAPKPKNAAPTKKPVINQPLIKKPATPSIDDEIQAAIAASEAIFHQEEAKSRGMKRK